MELRPAARASCDVHAIQEQSGEKPLREPMGIHSSRSRRRRSAARTPDRDTRRKRARSRVDGMRLRSTSNALRTMRSKDDGDFFQSERGSKRRSRPLERQSSHASRPSLVIARAPSLHRMTQRASLASRIARSTQRVFAPIRAAMSVLRSDVSLSRYLSRPRRLPALRMPWGIPAGKSKNSGVRVWIRSGRSEYSPVVA